MEPLKPEVKKRILQTTDATAQDIEEYERLQAKRYTLGPRKPPSSQTVAREDSRRDGTDRQKELADIEERISLLHKKLFPAKEVSRQH